MRNWIRVLLIGACLAVPLVLVQCSLDDSAGPADPGGGTGNNPPPPPVGSGEYNVAMVADPPVLEANGEDLSEITATITRADNGRPIFTGANVRFRTTLGVLNTDGTTQGTAVIIVRTYQGRARVFLVSGLTAGTAVVSAEVEGSRGTVSVLFTPPPEES